MVDKNARSGYANGPPWLFKGSALYQLHLVKSDTARHFIPKEFKLVEAFGYTLGGFFLAQYDDSPAGMFDELVVLAGIVWNPPTSCAWAARVLVNSDEACLHGRKDVGLPSHVAGFTKLPQRVATEPQLQGNRGRSFLDRIGLGTDLKKTKDHLEIEVKEIEGSCATAFCNISLPNSVAEIESTSTYAKQLGPMVRMSLPSFSGRTEYNPHLLKYSCQIECRIRPVKPAKVSSVGIALEDDQDSHSNVSSLTPNDMDNPLEERGGLRRSISVMLSKPILALEFNSLRMQVEAPRIVSRRWKQTEVS